MGNKRKGRSERKSITVTNDYVEHQSMFLTERDKAILTLLSQYPFLSSRNIYMMTPPTNEKAFFQIKNGQQRCNERIRFLFDKHFVYKFSPRKPPGKGTSVQYVLLDRAGLKYFNIDKKPTYYDDMNLPRHFYHTKEVLDIVATFYYYHYLNHIRILHIEYEPKLSYTDLKPDILICYVKDNKGYLQWIELDRGQKTIHKEKEKLNQLLSYKNNLHWRKEKWNQSLKQPMFPKLLYIVSTEHKTTHRHERLQELLNDFPFSSEVCLIENWVP
ncbi:MAG: hypothetical protein N2043_01940 [Ignavibacterium sp.]|nr:hypothetical protein [Ignavibacterium sp.]